MSSATVNIVWIWSLSLSSHAIVRIFSAAIGHLSLISLNIVLPMTLSSSSTSCGQFYKYKYLSSSKNNLRSSTLQEEGTYWGAVPFGNLLTNKKKKQKKTKKVKTRNLLYTNVYLPLIKARCASSFLSFNTTEISLCYCSSNCHTHWSLLDVARLNGGVLAAMT